MEMVNKGVVGNIVVDQKQPICVNVVAMELHEVGGGLCGAVLVVEVFNGEGQHNGSVFLDELSLGDSRWGDGGLRMEADEVVVRSGRWWLELLMLALPRGAVAVT
ncbi:hypothetical protein PIB30_015481 [Stylosanthes scabra]|uniref:Uncharacterized protein n=1 Tax=Stylosanthes scabra TaxID=79078 RepID=A0ABU6W5G6_9FABA|nr:hypothetical protein [Stylosanthes scabra]